MTESLGRARPSWADSLGHESRYLQLGGHRVHYLDEGDGPTVLLLHGNPVWSYVHREVITGLAPDYRCVAPDYPGFGLSVPAAGYGFTPQEHIATIEGFVDALDLTDIYLMANDWGGPIGLDLASRQPERFAGLIIGNTWAWPMTDKSTRRFSGFMGGPMGRFLNRNVNFFVRMALKAGLKRHKLTPEERAAYFGPFADRAARTAPTTFAKSIVAESDLLAGIEDRLHRFSETPVLILWPDQDFAFGPQHLQRWQHEFPNATTIELTGCGHYIQQDAPDEVVTHTRNWLATQVEQRPTP